MLPGYSGASFTTPPLGDARIVRAFDVRTGAALAYSADGDGRVTITGIDRTTHPEDSVVGVALDRPVHPADIAVGRPATAPSRDRRC